MGGQGLLDLFPNLIVTVARISPIQTAGESTSQRLVARPRQSSVRIHRPIKTTKFVDEILLGTERNLRMLGEEYMDRVAEEGKYPPIRDHGARKWTYASRAPDHSGSIGIIQFESGGYLLPAAPGDPYSFPAGILDRPRLSVQVDKGFDVTAVEESSGETVLTCVLKGIMSLFLVSVEKELDVRLPWVVFEGEDLSVADIMEEVS
jgi:hypothetical protein